MASTWKQPILSAVFQSMSSTLVILNSVRFGLVVQVAVVKTRVAAAHRVPRPRGASRAASASRSTAAVAALQHDEDDAVEDEHGHATATLL